MSIYQNILYPFSIHTSYFGSYAWSIELAFRLKASLQLFTVTQQDKEAASGTIRQSLLAAHEYYLHHFHHDGGQPPRLTKEPNIVTGELRDGLIHHLKNNAVDILIIDPAIQTQLGGSLKDVVQESKSAIILSELPDQQAKTDIIPITEHFYNQMRKAEFYKVPANFYASLSHDNKGHNYLRSLFQKSHH